MQLLLEWGAEIDHKTGAGNHQSSVLRALANYAPELRTLQNVVQL